MLINPSSRIDRIGSAIFAEVAEWKQEALRNGRDVIDLGIGSPDRPPSERVMHTLAQAAANPNHYGYPTSEGSPAFRQAAVKWLKHRFSIDIDASSEIVTLMGSQDGLSHLAMAIADPGDLAIVPNPGYPIYSASLVLAGVTSYEVPLRQENGFLPRFDQIPETIANEAKFMLLNYPGNPLAAVAERDFFEEWVRFARKHNLLIVHDLAYSEMAFDGFRPMSVLEVEGAKEIAVEFHSLSKSFNMAGCRIAFLAGQRDVVQALKALKSNIDYGVFTAIQEAGIAALEEDMEGGGSVALLYQRRRDALLQACADGGWHIPIPKATMFLWAPVPQGWTSRQISREIIENTGVVVIPGDAFGSEGDGYVRIALVQEEDRLVEAGRRITSFFRERGIL